MLVLRSGASGLVLPERSLVGPRGWLWGEAPPTRSRGRQDKESNSQWGEGGVACGSLVVVLGGGGGGVTEQLLIGQSSVTSGEAEQQQPISCCCSTFVAF